LLKKFKRDEVPTKDTIPVDDVGRRGDYFPWVLVPVLSMDKKTRPHRNESNFFDKLSYIISRLVNTKLKQLYGNYPDYPNLSREGKKKITTILSPFNNKLKFFDILMMSSDDEAFDTLKIIFPDITKEDIIEYKTVREDINEYTKSPL
jgi:hypothetical protein